MVWKALQTDKLELDMPPVIVAHQNHDHKHYALGKEGMDGGEEAALNLKAAGGKERLRCICDATHVVLKTGIKNCGRYWTMFDRVAPTLARFVLLRLWNPSLFFLLGATRLVCAALGLRTTATLAC